MMRSPADGEGQDEYEPRGQGDHCYSTSEGAHVSSLGCAIVNGILASLDQSRSAGAPGFQGPAYPRGESIRGSDPSAFATQTPQMPPWLSSAEYGEYAISEPSGDHAGFPAPGIKRRRSVPSGRTV